MFKFLTFFKTLLLGAVLATTLQAQAQTAAAPAAPIKVVYHLSDGIPQATRAIQNIRNHLAADPTAKIAVVTHGAGIDFLLDGATNTAQQSFAGAIGDLASKGVDFFVCNNTLVSRNIDPAKVAMEAKVVPSGVAEVARLQAREGFVYLRP
ncbi:DsrE family protein [Hydrogenophaga palleronii]|uniref:DsrE family protein n=1 Tax=Hydrogenophaga palleronii TaxID=65655 RepID=UPI000AED031B|nr:DsrE family protein [Hydrogenophaga palleronii]